MAADPVQTVSLVLLTKDFHPEKYSSLTKLLLSRYMKSGNPAVMLESYLSAFTRGTCPAVDNEMTTFDVQEYDQRHAYISASIKDVVIQFGIETILIYTALMLKKRIVVYHSKLRPLLAFCRALPSLVWHRQDWSFLYPWLDLDDNETNILRSRSAYIAGFTDPNVEARTDLYDILVNLMTSEITVAKHAKDSFSMGKLHKDIAMFMVHCVDDCDKSPQQIIKEIATKTKELLNNLQSLSVVDNEGRSVITLEKLREHNMPAATENFLFSLAAAEGLVNI